MEICKADKSTKYAAPIPIAKTINAAGNLVYFFKPKSKTNAATPAAKLHHDHCGARSIRLAIRLKGLPPLALTPNMMGNCLMMIVVAKANEKPCKTGREIKADKRPSRANATTIKPQPVSITSAKLSAARCSGLPGSNDKEAAATKAAEDEVGATMAKRLAPNKA